MLFFIDIRFRPALAPKDMSLDELWDIWEKEGEAAAAAKEALVSVVKVVGQRRVLVIIEAESHTQLDTILMAALPMANMLEVVEISPVRDYWEFQEQSIKPRWK